MVWEPVTPWIPLNIIYTCIVNRLALPMFASVQYEYGSVRPLLHKNGVLRYSKATNTRLKRFVTLLVIDHDTINGEDWHRYKFSLFRSI